MTVKALEKPPWTRNAEGKLRRVGVELEMTGLGLDGIAACVAGFLGARVSSPGRYERVLHGDVAGDWIVELDFDLLKKLGREPQSGGDSITAEIERSAEALLARAAEVVVPIEVVSPPLPLDRLPEVEALIVCLREAGAQGSSCSPVNAFGMQLNPELPSFDPAAITACIKSFLCLYEWLRERADVDLSRRVTSYVDPFPLDYVRKVLAPGYRPDLPTLIDDYLADNPTRNRALDMLPLFLHLDEARVRRAADDVLIKARPTFHYRLPDCDIDEPGWGLYLAWNDWVEVERLAADPERLAGCARAHLAYLSHPLDRLLGDWPAVVEARWLGR